MNKVLLRSTLDRSNLHTLTDLLPIRNAPVLAIATLLFSHSTSAALHRIAYYQSPSLRPFRYTEANLPLPPYL